MTTSDTSSRRVLVDSSVLIAAFDRQGTSGTQMQDKAVQTMRRLGEDESVEIVLTPLVLHETLRGVPQVEKDRAQELEKVLSDFPVLPLDEGVVRLATALYKQLVASNTIIKSGAYKRNYDLMHFATAKHHNCEFEHNESGGFVGYQAAYEAFQNRDQ